MVGSIVKLLKKIVIIYTGVAGVTYALLDIQDPIAANIPGF